MLFVLFILAAITAGAQPLSDGVPLLRQVTEAARSAKGWRAEGAFEYDLLHAEPGRGWEHEREPITIATRGPLELRHIHGRLPGVLEQTVCDGLTAWHKKVLSGLSFYIDADLSSATAKECSPPVALDWENLLRSLRSAQLFGSDNTLGCTLVRAEYWAPAGLEAWYRFQPDHLASLGPVIREMCVDEASSAVVWERFEVTGESMHYVVEITKIERDPRFSPEEFKIPLDALDDRSVLRPVTLDLLDSLPVLPVPARPQ